MKLSRWFLCAVLNKHEYTTLKALTRWSSKIGCAHCDRVWLRLDWSVHLFPWTEALAAYYDRLTPPTPWNTRRHRPRAPHT